MSIYLSTYTRSPRESFSTSHSLPSAHPQSLSCASETSSSPFAKPNIQSVLKYPQNLSALCLYSTPQKDTFFSPKHTAGQVNFFAESLSMNYLTVFKILSHIFLLSSSIPTFTLPSNHIAHLLFSTNSWPFMYIFPLLRLLFFLRECS